MSTGMFSESTTSLASESLSHIAESIVNYNQHTHPSTTNTASISKNSFIWRNTFCPGGGAAGGGGMFWFIATRRVVKGCEEAL
jgi:hypothetical protein